MSEAPASLHVIQAKMKMAGHTGCPRICAPPIIRWQRRCRPGRRGPSLSEIGFHVAEDEPMWKAEGNRNSVEALCCRRAGVWDGEHWLRAPQHALRQ